MAFPLTSAEHYAIDDAIMAIPELIVSAAVQTPLGIITRERPARHGDLWSLLPSGMKSSDPDVIHGFMTSRGRFVGRQEAASLVVETGQGSPRLERGYTPSLFSEDLWLDLFELEPRISGAQRSELSTQLRDEHPSPPSPVRGAGEEDLRALVEYVALNAMDRLLPDGWEKSREFMELIDKARTALSGDPRS